MKKSKFLKVLSVLTLILCLSTSFVGREKVPTNHYHPTTCLEVNFTWSGLVPDYPKFQIGGWYVTIDAGGSGMADEVRSTYAFIAEHPDDDYGIYDYMASVWGEAAINYDVFRYDGCTYNTW